MKTTKLFLSILGVALTALSFGQFIAFNKIPKESDLNITRFTDDETEVLFYTPEYNLETGRVIHWVNHVPRRAYENVTSMESSVPMVSRTYWAKVIEVNYEESLVLEEWMTTPFVSSIESEEDGIEGWMITPFDIEPLEETYEIEDWMTSAWI